MIFSPIEDVLRSKFIPLLSSVLNDSIVEKFRVSNTPIGEILDTSFYKSLFAKELIPSNMNRKIKHVLENNVFKQQYDEHFTMTELINEIGLLVLTAKYTTI